MICAQGGRFRREAHISDATAYSATLGARSASPVSIGCGHVQVHEGVNAVRDAEPAWHTIASDAVAVPPFQSWSVAKAAATAHAARGEIPRIVVVQEQGKPVVIFPTVIRSVLRIAVARFLGDPLVQYGDALVSRDATPKHLEIAWEAATDPKAVDAAFFRKVRADSPIAPLLIRYAQRTSCDSAPFIRVNAARISSSRHMRDVRRLRRRLTDHGEVRFQFAGGRMAEEILQETLAFKRAWLIERGLPSAVFGDAAWEQALSDLTVEQGSGVELIATRLTVAGRTAATEVGLVTATHWFAYTGALNPDFVKGGPGHVLMEDIIAWCAATGRTTYDLLAPNQPYKRAIASETVDVHDYALCINALGRPLMMAVSAPQMAKRALAAIPLPVRQWMMRTLLAPGLTALRQLGSDTR